MTAAAPQGDGSAAAGGDGGGLAPPAISLPKGGGAIRGIDEKFSVNPTTGTGTLSVPLPVSPARPGTTPALALSYDSGAGNGPFGHGWSVDLPMVARKTDKGVPRYRDAEDSDVFVLSEAEDLVPLLVPGPGGWTRSSREETEGVERYLVERYRPRVEGTFARIERWTRRRDGDMHWRATSPGNLLTIYGRSPAARVADPADPARVFLWLIQESRDDRGNVTLYEYKAENAQGIDRRAPQERARLAGPGFAQRYLKRVRYLNGRPGRTTGFLLELVLDYGEHDEAAPQPGEARPWPVRADPFSSYRAGFEVRTYRLCRRALMFHRFPELGPAPTLVRSLDLGYREDPVLTKLVTLTAKGYIRDGAGYRSDSLPPVELAYSEPELHRRVYEVDEGSLEHLPAGSDGRIYQWADLDSEGIAGVVAEQGGAWFYKRNLGEGRLAPVELVSPRPSAAALASGRTQLMDLAGDGALDLVQLEGPEQGFHERRLGGEWQPFRRFRSMPAVRFDDPNLRLVDLTGDGRADVLVTEDEVLRWYASLGAAGFGEAETVPKPQDEDDGPRLVFADGTQTIFLADMSGDGLTDLVRIRDGEVCYWPSLGHGRFGAKLTMDHPPLFAEPDGFDPGRIRLGDTDGSGVTDLVYLGREGVTIWLNQAGNAWSAPQRLAPFPPVDGLADVAVTDLLGTGTACLVWSSPLPGERGRHLRYVDLMGSRKPHLLTEVANGVGQRRRLSYAPSTRFALADRAAGRPWATRLPFPVHVLERLEVEDLVAHTRLVTTYRYHHGHYDGAEREFAGFALVEQEDAESYAAAEQEHHLPPVLTRTWAHTGSELGDRISRQLAAEYWDGTDGLPDGILRGARTAREVREAHRALRGRIVRQEICALDGAAEQDEPYSVAESSYDVELLQPSVGGAPAVFCVHDRERLSVTYERDRTDPRVQHELVLATDGYGHVTHSASVSYPRPSPAFAAQGETIVTEVEHDLVNRPRARGWYRLGVPVESRTYEATGLAAPAGRPYRLEELEAALAAAQRRLVDRTRTLYYRNDRTGALPPGQIESLALPYATYRAALDAGDVAAAFGGRVTPAMLAGEGGYLLRDGFWWRPSSREIFDSARFYWATGLVDPFGNTHTSTPDAHSFLVESKSDPLGNTTTTRNNYRVLAPWLVTDPNGNRQAVRFDALGVTVATFAMGKAGSGDGDRVDEGSQEASPLDDPTARVEIDRLRFRDHGRPNVVRTLARELHGAANVRWQESRIYLDGSGRELETKVQAEPGLAPGRSPDGTLRRDPAGVVVLEQVDPRWVGTGRTVYDNKGNPVRRWEPFFSATGEYEDEADLVETGVSDVLRYDPLGRLVRTDHPNGTFATVSHAAWREERWDENDTVLESGWYAERAQLPGGDPERRAADLAAAHAATPSVTHLDPLGRAFVVEADNGPDVSGARIVHRSTTLLDVEGNVLSLTDPRGVATLERAYDLAGACVRRRSADCGERFELVAVDGNRIRTWDGRGHASRIVYDGLRRPTHHFLAAAAGPELLVELSVYGEEHATPEAVNLRGRRYQLYDAAGVLTDEGCDFKGNLLRGGRRFALEYRQQVDWSVLAGLAGAATIAAAAAPLLEPESFDVASEFDALDRPVAVTAPDGSVARPAYSEASLLDRLDVQVRGGVPTTFVEAVDYDAQRRRERIRYPGGVVTDYGYDPLTFRLTRLRTTRGATVLQDLRQTYDPVGNVVEVRDDAQQAVFFQNGVAPAGARYEYDPVYRLVLAQGREHAGQAAVAEYDWSDGARAGLPHPHDAAALRAYAEEYSYDAAGNLESLVHHLGTRTGSVLWRRRQEYAADSNRLLSTSFPGDGPGPLPPRYTYDGNGNITAMPHLAEMRWSARDQLAYATPGGGTDVYLVHDAAGERARKVVEKNGGALVEDRRYLGGFEVFRRRTAAGLQLERETLHVADDRRRVALVETLTVDGGTPIVAPAPAARFQIGDALGSAALELDSAGAVISYEEYYPYGGTSYQAGPNAAEVSLKRYRYTGKERDEETGFYACGVRLYAPWLGRWTSCDPAGAAGGTNLYRYAECNPVRFVDPTGKAPLPANPLRFTNLTYALDALTNLTTLYKKEFAVAQDLATREYMIFEGSGRSVSAPQGFAALAHSHVPPEEISSQPSIRKGSDLDVIRRQALAGEAADHAIYFEADRTLVQAKEGANRLTATTFTDGGEVLVTDYAHRPGNNPNAGATDWDVLGTPNDVKAGRAALWERVKAALGSDVASFAAESGASSRFKSALATGRGLVGGLGHLLNFAGTAAGGWQLGSGFDKAVIQGDPEGAADIVEGLGGLDLSIGTAIAVKKGAIIAETGIAAGGIAALATVAAGGAVYLLGETIRAAVKGVETPIEVADKYYGTGFADIPGWIERGAASFANEYRKVQFYRRRAQVEGAR